MRRLILILAAAGALIPALSSAAVTPSPFAATYAVNFRGMHAGELKSTLRAEAPNRFVYETRAKPSFFARFFIGKDAIERSLMRIDGNGVQPLSWFSEDGKSGEKRDGYLDFAWDEGRVRGNVEGSPVDISTVTTVQDRLSLQVAVMTALLRTELIGTIAMIDDGQIKYYRYKRVRAERIRTAAGEFETVLYESSRHGSSRVSRVWHAPELGYVPVRAEQVRKGKVETVMELLKLERGHSATPAT